MTKRSYHLDAGATSEDSTINSVGARLGLYAVLAAAVAACTGLALRRSRRRAARLLALEDAETDSAAAEGPDPARAASTKHCGPIDALPFRPETLIHTGSHLAARGHGASIKSPIG